MESCGNPRICSQSSRSMYAPGTPFATGIWNRVNLMELSLSSFRMWHSHQADSIRIELLGTQVVLENLLLMWENSPQRNQLQKETFPLQNIKTQNFLTTILLFIGNAKKKEMFEIKGKSLAGGSVYYYEELHRRSSAEWHSRPSPLLVRETTSIPASWSPLASTWSLRHHGSFILAPKECVCV